MGRIPDTHSLGWGQKTGTRGKGPLAPYGVASHCPSRRALHPSSGEPSSACAQWSVTMSRFSAAAFRGRSAVHAKCCISQKKKHGRPPPLVVGQPPSVDCELPPVKRRLRSPQQPQGLRSVKCVPSFRQTFLCAVFVPVWKAFNALLLRGLSPHTAADQGGGGGDASVDSEFFFLKRGSPPAPGPSPPPPLPSCLQNFSSSAFGATVLCVLWTIFDENSFFWRFGAQKLSGVGLQPARRGGSTPPPPQVQTPPHPSSALMRPGGGVSGPYSFVSPPPPRHAPARAVDRPAWRSRPVPTAATPCPASGSTVAGDRRCHGARSPDGPRSGPTARRRLCDDRRGRGRRADG